MPFNPLLAGQDLTSTFFNASIDNARSMRYQKTDITRNNTTTYLDSTDLVLPVLANGAYTFEACFFIDSTTTADAKVRLTLPASSAALISKWGQDVGVTGTTNAVNQQGAAPVANVVEWTIGGAGTGTIVNFRPAGWINISGTAGNLVIGFAQNTASAVNSLFKTG